MDLEREKRVAALRSRFEEFRKFEQLNNTAVDAKWRDILATEKNKQQKASLDRVRATYTKQLDRCDAIIHRLFQWISEGENQYQFALRSHKQNLELLSHLANQRLDRAFSRFQTQLQGVRDEYNENRRRALEEYNRHVAEVKDITAAIEHEYSLKKSQMDSQFKNERETLLMKSQEAISTLRTHLMEETSNVTKAIKQAHDNFKAKSEGKMQQFNQMFEKHKQRQKIMKANEEEIIKKAAEISHWRRKIKNNERESREGNERLRQEKENLSLHFRELKQTMATFRTTEGRKLAEISVAYDTAIKEMEEKMKLAEKILKYAEMTRKLETEREHVMPFPKSITETDPEIVKQMQQFKNQLKGDAKYVAESDLFDKFYRRFNKVLLDKLTLQRQRESLMQHNRRLKSMMTKYMDGMGVSPDALSKPNTLFIVNQNTNAPKRRVEQDTIPKIDAQFTLEANALQGY